MLFVLMLHFHWTSLYLHPFNCTTFFSAAALCFHKIASSLFLNVPAPLSHYSRLLVFFFKDRLSSAFAVLRFRGLHFLLSPSLHQFSQPPPFFHTQVYICVHSLSISVMDLNTFPPALHPLFLFCFCFPFPKWAFCSLVLLTVSLL